MSDQELVKGFIVIAGVIFTAGISFMSLLVALITLNPMWLIGIIPGATFTLYAKYFLK